MCSLLLKKAMDIGTVLGAMRCLCANNSIFDPLCKQCKYLKNPKSKVKLLEKKLKLLIARGQDVENKLNEESICVGRKPKAEVNLWVEDVKTMACSINIVELSEDRCLRECFPNYISRIKLGKLVEKKIYEIDELLKQQENFLESSLVSTVPRRGWIFPERTMIGNSSRWVLEKTWNYLMDKNIGIVGIYGMGGVGKTTTAIEINNRLLREKTLFDHVIWVTASKESSIQKLQKDIAESVDLRFEENDDEMKRAAKLLEILSRKARFLLIIDDLWEGFPVESIGIPNPAKEKICKIIITTRSLSVCHQMETDKEVEVRMLLEEEGWELFKHKVGAEVFSCPDIEHHGKSIARECGGLPLAIITVGRALRKESDPAKWQDALGELRSSMVRFTNMENLVLSRLKFSYERLSEMTKSCFLYCALYPKDHFMETEELLNYWMWEELLLGYDSSVRSMRQLGRSILRELKDASMLESVNGSGSNNEYVKMHDLIREMAINLTRETSMVQSGLGMDRPPSVENWSSQVRRVSLMRNDLRTLDCVPQCPALGTLLLQYNSLNKEIHPDFFGQMNMLRFLDLSFTGILKLPQSFSNLKNLRVLLLRSCWNLKFLPTLAHFTCLMVLDLAYTSIKSTPEGMQRLSNLRHLDLSYSSIEDFPTDALYEYTLLGNLLVMGTQIFSPDKLKSLNLETLETNFRSLKEFGLYIRSGKWQYLESFKFCIGFPPSLVNMQKNGIGLFGVAISPGNGGGVWRFMHELVIHKCTNLTQLPEYIASSSHELRSCKIQYCNDMQWIFAGRNRFPKLERLVIEGLKNLTKLCKGVMPEGLLINLKILHVSACDKMISLIPAQMGRQLKTLEEIQVENCENIRVIFAADEEDDEITEVCDSEMVLPGLKKMKLTSLPQLMGICNNHITCDSLSLVEVRYCQMLEGLALSVGGSSLLSSVILSYGNGTWSKHTKRYQDDKDYQDIGSSSRS
ncbi:hypothetical protein M9H77_20104 [Catharanthus roseus]|uniref:Uncharacterized protein n=1 Tax=Catharanthus roseus TaxID=4058 RepID=A0ACC0AMR2_CATRO|nr:hypothetical protein M9H77_20104 [Catharanthus roseus]